MDARAGDRPVAVLADGLGNAAPYESVWREVAFFNTSVARFATTEATPRILRPRTARHVVVRVGARDGALRLRGGGALPRLWLVPTLFRRLGLAGDRVASAGYLPVELVRLRGAPRATFAWEGPDLEGYLPANGGRTVLRVFPAARPCVRILLQGPPEFTGTHRFAVAAGSVRRTGELRTGERAEVVVPVGPAVDNVVVRGFGSVDITPDRPVSLQIALTEAGPDCA